MKEKILVYDDQVREFVGGKLEFVDQTHRVDALRNHFDKVIKTEVFDKLDDISNKSILAVGQGAYNSLRNKTDFGLRTSNNFFLLTQLPILKLSQLNTEVVFMDNLVIDERGRDKLRIYFTQEGKQQVIPDLPNKVFITKLIESYKYIELLKNYSGELGFDYETNGFPEDEFFSIVGSGFSTIDTGFYFDWRCLYLDNPDEFNNTFLPKFKSLLDKKHKEIIVFNYRFEMNASYNYFNTFYKFIDAGIYRVIIGKHQQQYWTLKYMAQFFLKVGNWDANYDGLIKRFNESGALQSRESLEEFVDNSEFDDETKLEFLKWYDSGYTTEFNVIPTKLIGEYCMLDSYYTLMIHKENQKTYSDDCIQVFASNARFAARMTEPFIDLELRDSMLNESLNNSNNYNLLAGWIYWKRKYEEVDEEIINTYESLPDKVREVLKLGVDSSTKLRFGKSICIHIFDEDYDNHINSSILYKVFGNEYPILEDKIVQTLGPEWIYDNIKRQRTIFEVITNHVMEFLETPFENIQEVGYISAIVNNLIRLEAISDDMENILDKPIQDRLQLREQLKGIFNLASGSGSGNEFNQYNRLNPMLSGAMEVAYWDDIVSNGIHYEKNFNPEVSHDLTHLNSMKEVINYISQYKSKPSKEKLDFMSIDIRLPEIDFRWLFHTKRILINEVVNKEFFEYFNNIKNMSIKQLKEDGRDYEDIIMRLLHLGFNKYTKLITTYLGNYFEPTIFKDYNKDLRVLRTDNPSIPRIRFSFNPHSADTKRWSSGAHTIPSSSHTKRVITSPLGMFNSYFDISAAEVRTFAYYSQDSKLMHYFDNGIDPYLATAEVVFPEKTDGERYALRNAFKVVVLGLFFGMGADSLAGNLGSTVQESEVYLNAVMSEFPTLVAFIDELRNYASKYGMARSRLGDIIPVPRGQAYTKGVNSVIQSNTSVILVYGFENLLGMSDELDYGLQSFMTVHDSASFYNRLDNLATTYDFYDEHFRRFVVDRFTTNYAFDLMIGDSYWSDLFLGRSDEDGFVPIKGNSGSIKLFLDHARKTHDTEIISDNFDENNLNYIDHEMTNSYHLVTPSFHFLTHENSEIKLKLHNRNLIV